MSRSTMFLLYSRIHTVSRASTTLAPTFGNRLIIGQIQGQMKCTILSQTAHGGRCILDRYSALLPYVVTSVLLTAYMPCQPSQIPDSRSNNIKPLFAKSSCHITLWSSIVSWQSCIQPLTPKSHLLLSMLLSNVKIQEACNSAFGGAEQRLSSSTISTWPPWSSENR